MQLKNKLMVVEFILICTRFLRGLAVIFLGVDIALSYNEYGVKLTSTLIMIIITVFGIYGFLSYGIMSAENFLDMHGYKRTRIF